MYEEVLSDSAEKLICHFENNPPKGEFVLMVSPPKKIDTELPNIEQILRQKMTEKSLKTAVKEVCDEFSLSKNEVYALALRLKNE